MEQMKKYRHRWSYDPRAKQVAQKLPSLTIGIIIQGVIGTFLAWGLISLMWLAW